MREVGVKGLREVDGVKGGIREVEGVKGRPVTRPVTRPALPLPKAQILKSTACSDNM